MMVAGADFTTAAGPARVSAPRHTASPFSGRPDRTYDAWRDWKLSNAPQDVDSLIVEVGALGEPRVGEIAKIRELCRQANFAIYATTGTVEKRDIVKFGAAFGLDRLDKTHCADDDAITELKVEADGQRATYIPYSNRPLSWHTDGYYNAASEQVRGFILHCQRPAETGGDSLVLDPDLAYIHLMDVNPDYIGAMMEPNAMTIPENVEAGRLVRGAETGPVFSMIGGDLHMRYSARKRNIAWKDDSRVACARAVLDALLDEVSPAPFRFRLQPGQGIICNNVLHRRTGFDAASDRLFFRARYLDRVSGTSWQGDAPLQKPT